MTPPPQQPGSYEPPDPFGPGPFDHSGHVRPRRATGRIVGFVVAIIVAMGAGIGGYLLFFRTDTLSANQVASGFAHSFTSLAHSMSAGDLTQVDTFLCARDRKAVQSIYQRQQAKGGPDRSFSMVASGVRTNGEIGSFTILVTDQGATRKEPGNLVRQQDKWVVCDTVAG